MTSDNPFLPSPELKRLRESNSQLPVMAKDRSPEQDRVHEAWVDAEVEHGKAMLRLGAAETCGRQKRFQRGQCPDQLGEPCPHGDCEFIRRAPALGYRPESGGRSSPTSS